MTAEQSRVMIAELNRLSEEGCRFPRGVVYEAYRHGAIRLEGVGRAARVMKVGDRLVFIDWLRDDDDNPVIGV